MSLIPTLGRQRQAHLCEFKASLVYRASSWITGSRQRNPVWKNKNKNNRKTTRMQKGYSSMVKYLPGIQKAGWHTPVILALKR